MQKISLTYRILSLVLAALVFVSAVGVSIDMHYCSGEFKSASLMGKAPVCHPPTAMTCPHHQKKMKAGLTDGNNCCSNKTVHFQSEEDMDASKVMTHTLQPLQMVVFAYVQSFLGTVQLLSDCPVFIAYKPPPLFRDIPVLVQSFLI